MFSLPCVLSCDCNLCSCDIDNQNYVLCGNLKLLERKTTCLSFLMQLLNYLSYFDLLEVYWFCCWMQKKIACSCMLIACFKMFLCQSSNYIILWRVSIHPSEQIWMCTMYWGKLLFPFLLTPTALLYNVFKAYAGPVLVKG